MAPKLVAIRMDNFKSFHERIEIPICDGFTCITGENGAGKSNLLDAVSFALGEAPSNLRVKSLNALCGVPGRKVEVELVFDVVVPAVGSDKGEKSQMRLGSCILDGSRYFLLQGSRLPKHRFDEAVTSFGLHVGGQAVWRITQSEIDKKIKLSPSDLYDAISQVSGTKQFNERREDAIKQVKSCKQALVEVRAKLSRLGAEVAEGRALVADSERKEELAIELSVTIPAKKASLEVKLASFEMKSHNEKLTAAAAALSLARIAQAQHEAAVQAETARVSAEDVKDSKPIAPDDTAREQRAVAAAAVEEARAALLESEAKAKGCTAFQSTLPSLVASLVRLSTVIYPDLKMKCTALRSTAQQARQRVEAINKQDGGSDVRAVLLEAANEARSEVRRSKVAQKARTEELAEARSCFEAAVAEKASLEAQVTPKLAHWGQLETTVSSQCAEAGFTKFSSHTAPKDIEAAIITLQGQERDARARITSLAAKCMESESELRCWMPAPGDSVPGQYLFEAVDFTASDGDTMRAIETILGSSLTVRVVNDTSDGLAFGKFAKAAGRASRIWPLDRIDCPRGSLAARRRAATAQVLEGMPSGGGVIDPLALLSYDKSDAAVSAAVVKAVGTWVVVKDDATAASVLKAGGLKAVTLSGNQHTPGRLVGGGVLKSGKLQAAEALKQARGDMTTALAAAADLDRRLSLMRHAADGAWSLLHFAPQRAHHVANLKTASAEEARLAIDVAGAVTRLESAALNTKLWEDREHDAELAVEQSGARALTTLKAAAAEAVAALEAAEEELAETEEEAARLMDGLRPNSAEVEDFLVTCAAKEITANRMSGKLFTDVETTMLVCDLAVAASATEVSKARHELAQANLAKEQASAAVAAAADAADALRVTQHQARAELQRQYQLAASGARQIKNLEAEVAAHDQAAAKATAKFQELRKAVEAGINAEDADDDNLGSFGDIKNTIHALAAEESAYRDELKSLRKKSMARPTGPTNRGELKSKIQAITTLEGQLCAVVDAIRLLERGMDDAVELMKVSNRRCFETVRESFRSQVARLLPGKQGDLKPVAQELESGISLGVQSCGVQDDCGSTNDLSGGQKSLVGLALTFSLSACRRLPLYVLDEVDAPLDEHNQALAADSIALTFAGSQVLCVSHHAPFHRRADNIVQISRQNESSKLLRCVKQSITKKRNDPITTPAALANDGSEGFAEDRKRRAVF